MAPGYVPPVLPPAPPIVLHLSQNTEGEELSCLICGRGGIGQFAVAPEWLVTMRTPYETRTAGMHEGCRKTHSESRFGKHDETPLHRLAGMVRANANFSSVVVSLEKPPKNPGGVWWLDVAAGGKQFNVEWSPSRGFGLHLSQEEGYGTKPDEVYPGLEGLYTRLSLALSEALGRLG